MISTAITYLGTHGVFSQGGQYLEGVGYFRELFAPGGVWFTMVQPNALTPSPRPTCFMVCPVTY
jgi:hypothetical protein